MTRKALFLDRDGVINEDLGYVFRASDFCFIDGIFELCRAATQTGFDIIVITNQAGIARGYYSEAEFLELTNWMVAHFSAQGISIRKVFYCPYHPTAGIGPYLRDAECRKPKPGMILAAREEFGFDLKSSILIGDEFTDIEAGRRAGVGLNLLLSREHVDGVASVSSLRAAIPTLAAVASRQSTEMP